IDEDSDKDGDFFVDPFTGKKLGDLPPKNQFFQAVTSFHRSLFLKSTGRAIIGITSFLFLLSIITGLLFLAQRDGGWRSLFQKTVKTTLRQYLHVSISKWTWIPLTILAFTGVYLSLLRFEFVPEKELIAVDLDGSLKDTSYTSLLDFPALQGLTIGDLEKIEFPFSEDEMDPYTIQLHDKKLLVHQYNGQAIEAYEVAFINQFSDWNFLLHTGAGNIPWAIIIGLSTLGSLYLIYSGLVITYKRLRTRKLPQKYKPEEAEYVLLFGSENGATKDKAITLYHSLLEASQKVVIQDLNSFQVYPKLKKLLILTSTYGEGEAPGNANQFLSKLEQFPLTADQQYAVLGFGSLAYPEFCKFAEDIAQQLVVANPAGEIQPLRLIHNQSIDEFIGWGKNLSINIGIPIKLTKHLSVKIPTLDQFQVIDRQQIIFDGQITYLIRLATQKKQDFQSGDLLNFYPPEDSNKRSYSIGKDSEGHILLAIRKHAKGIVSNFLLNVPIGEMVKATIDKNPHFHLPKKAKEVLLVGNGTGIGPFLGMIQASHSANLHLYWGGKAAISYQLYQPIIQEMLATEQLDQFQKVLSRSGSQEKYVQDLLIKDKRKVAQALESGA
ncbi:MAG: PepSY domain-containing protein, partial [Bacteroidota bacterium]